MFSLYLLHLHEMLGIFTVNNKAHIQYILYKLSVITTIILG